MKLLHIAPRYYPHVGGVEYVVKSVAERLVKRKHSVTVLCGESSLKDPREEWVNGVLVVRWPVWSPGDAYHIPRLRNRLKKWLLEVSRECDAVHFHSVHSFLSIYALKALKDFGIHKVITPYYHGTGHTVFRRILWKAWRSYVKRILPYTMVVHTVSKLEAKLVEKDFKAKALPIENGVDEWILNLSWLPSGYAIYSGRIEKYKNVHRLANIVRILNTRFGMDLELRVFGSGPYVSSLRRQLKGLGLKFSISPPQPFEDYLRTVSKASFFGLLSRKESYPQSINEANAIGVPVIVAEPWGLNFKERRRTLIIKLNESDEAIAEKTYTFLQEAAREPRSEVPSWDRVVELYLKFLYES